MIKFLKLASNVNNEIFAGEGGIVLQPSKGMPEETALFGDTEIKDFSKCVLIFKEVIKYLFSISSIPIAGNETTALIEALL